MKYIFILGLVFLLLPLVIAQDESEYTMSFLEPGNGGHNIFTCEQLTVTLPTSDWPECVDKTDLTNDDGPETLNAASINCNIAETTDTAGYYHIVWNTTFINTTVNDLYKINLSMMGWAVNEVPDNVSVFFYNFSSSKWDMINDNYQYPSAGGCCGGRVLLQGNQTTEDDLNDYINGSKHMITLIWGIPTGGAGEDTIAMDLVNLTLQVKPKTSSRIAADCPTGPEITIDEGVALGFDFFNETDQEDMTTVDGEASFVIWQPGNVTTTNLTVSSFTDISQLSICIQPNYETWIVNGTVQYEDEAYRLNHYYINNLTLSAPPNENFTVHNFSLYLIHEDIGTGTSIEVLDEDRDPLENVYGFIQRYDPGTQTFRTVTMIKTDSDGKDFTYLQHQDAWYRFIFTRYLETLDITEIKKITDTELSFDIFPNPFSDQLSTLAGVKYNLTYDDNLGRFQVIFLDPTGRVVEGCLQVSRDVALNRTFLYNKCETTSFGTISYSPTNLTGTYYASFYYKLPAASPQSALVQTISVVVGGITDLFDIGKKEGAAFTFFALTVFVPFTALIHVYVPFLLLPVLLIAVSSSFFHIFDISVAVGGGLLIMGIAIIAWIEWRRK